MTEITQAFHAIQTIVEMNNQNAKHADQIRALQDRLGNQFDEILELRRLVETQRVEISEQQEVLSCVNKLACENRATHHEVRRKLRKKLDELDTEIVQHLGDKHELQQELAVLRSEPLAQKVAEPRDQPEAQPMQHGP